MLHIFNSETACLVIDIDQVLIDLSWLKCFLQIGRTEKAYPNIELSRNHLISEFCATMGNRPSKLDVEELIEQLTAIRTELILTVKKSNKDLSNIHPNFGESAKNLLHYLVLRRRDLRKLQNKLAEFGLSSLGRSESHVLATIDAVLYTLHRLAHRECPQYEGNKSALGFKAGHRLLKQHTTDLLGKKPKERKVHIMVTMPSEAADDSAFVYDLLRSGMNCMRINCAHDDRQVWQKMIENLRQAKTATKLPCKIIMDLAGPKLRTGKIVPGPEVIKVRPKRDRLGRTTDPFRLWAAPGQYYQSSPATADACLPVDTLWLQSVKVGDGIKLEDTRGRKRTLKVIDKTDEGCWLEGFRTTYLGTGTTLKCHRKHGKGGIATTIEDIQGKEVPIVLFPDDVLVLKSQTTLGRSAMKDSGGKVLTPASISCTLPEILEHVKAGDSVWFDDGKIGGDVETKKQGDLYIRITQTPINGGKLRSDKGINFPDSSLKLPAITEKDKEDLEFIARHADMVALSFANTVKDVKELKGQLRKYENHQLGIVLKIETVGGFKNLPKMLFETMSVPACGVMIARGDLAVESGFERLAEVQEEILWLCEAAHVPVIWATQVLETLAKEGAPTRAEITDAAMGHRAECVMLNKGPHINDAVKALNDILTRMQSHQIKKRSMLRELKLAYGFSPIE